MVRTFFDLKLYQVKHGTSTQVSESLLVQFVEEEDDFLEIPFGGPLSKATGIKLPRLFRESHNCVCNLSYT